LIVETDNKMKTKTKRTVLSWVLAAFVTVGLILSAIFSLLALLFLDNFNFSSRWHVFVFGFTFLAPILSIAGLLAFNSRKNNTTTIIALLLAAAPLVTYYLWSLDASRGLAH